VALAYLVVANAYQTLLLAAAAAEARVHRHVVWLEGRERWLSSPAAPRVSVLAPAYSEEATIRESVRALLTLSYPNLEVVVVNDGSPDGTLATLEDEFALTPIPPIYRRQLETKAVRGMWRSGSHPALVVVDKKNGGKADTLNVALDVASGDLVCAIDADTLIESDALLRIARPFLRGRECVAAGGTIGVANGSTVRDGRVREPRPPRRWLAGVQCVEYLRAFLFGRLGWNRLGGNLIISGAFGLFRRDAVVAVGGYVDETVGEDMELIAAVRRWGVEASEPAGVTFVADPVAWTEVPETLSTLARQRNRWHRGLTDVLRRHRRMIANPRYGALGTVVMPYFTVVELLGPVVEALGLAATVIALLLGAVSWPFAVLFLLVAYGWGMVLSLTAVLLEHAAGTRYPRPGDKALLALWAALENLGYRQLTVWWRLRGLASYLGGAREWGVMQRRGFAGQSAG
jgi:cellulose synthase/poly-beta-1,6-N-acetylglucosamine synthase-like glycosyltransferase